MADSGHPPAELHERLLICRTIKLNAGALGGHRRCCHAQMQKNAQNKPQIARLILCVHTTLQVYCNLFLTFCGIFCPCRKPGEKSEGKHCTNPDECAILCITVPAHRPETDVFRMLSGGGGPSRSCITGMRRRSTPSLRLPPLFHHGRRALLPGTGGDAGPPGGRMRPGFGAPIFRRTALGERAAPSHQILNF